MVRHAVGVGIDRGIGPAMSGRYFTPAEDPELAESSKNDRPEYFAC
jgi:hypothetical protein